MIHQIDVERRDDLAPANQTGVNLSRRALMNKIVAVTAAASIPTVAPAMPSEPDPIFAALTEFSEASAAFYAPGLLEKDLAGEIGDRWQEAAEAVASTRPTTPAGLAALTGWARDQLERRHDDASVWGTEVEDILVATIDDATRGMSGLTAWEPPATRVNPDAKLIELGREFERLLSIELPLKDEHEKRSQEASRLHRAKLGYDDDDHDAKREIPSDDWNNAWKEVDEETGRSAAYHKWNNASARTAKIGKKILRVAPKTTAGFLIRVRVIETHDEIGKSEPLDQILEEIRNFAKFAA